MGQIVPGSAPISELSHLHDFPHSANSYSKKTSQKKMSNESNILPQVVASEYGEKPWTEKGKSSAKK